MSGVNRKYTPDISKTMNCNVMAVNYIKHTPMMRILLLMLLFALGAITNGFAQSITLSISSTSPACAGYSDGSATALASGGVAPYTFVWSNTQQGQTIEGINAGTYSVTVSDNAGQTAAGSVQVTEPAALQADVITSFPSCNGSAGVMVVVVSGGTTPYSTVWSNGIVGAVGSGLVPGVQYTATTTDAKGCQLITPVTVSEIDSLTVNIATAWAACPGIDNGTATALVTPPGGLYQYDWNISDQNTAQLTGLAGNTAVAVTVTDQNSGCTGMATGLVVWHVQPALALNNTPSVVCAGDLTGAASAIASMGTAPYSYAWTGPGSSTYSGPNLTGLGAGAYMVTATDAGGCTITGTVNIGVLSSLKADFNLQQVCANNIITFEITDNSVDTSSTITSWNWTINDTLTSTNQTPPAFTMPNAAAGNIQLIVSSAIGCVDTVSRDFTARAFPDVTIQTAGFTCDGSPVIIKVNGSPSLTYNWIPPDGITYNPDTRNVLADPDSTTNYALLVSDSTCFDTIKSILVIRQPVPFLEAPDVKTCTNQAALTANTNLPSVIWSTFGIADTLDPTAVPPGTYIVTASDSLCTLTDTVQVTLGSPNATCNAVQQPTCGLNNGIVGVTASGGTAPYTYLWNTQDTTQTVSNLGGGTYTVTVTDAAGCTATCSVTLTPTGGLTAECAAVEQPNCGLNNGTVSITAGGGTAPYTYLWNTQDTTQTVTGLGGGTYTVTVTDANGCTGTCSVTLTPISGVTANCSVVQQPTCGLNNGIITVTASGCTPPYTYLWNTQDTTQTVSNLGPGTYTVTVTSADGFTATCSLVLNPSEGPTATCNAVQQPTCGLNNGIVSVTASGGTAPYTYLWNTQDTTQTVSNLGGGTYTVTVTDAAGCTATCSVTLTPTGGLTADCVAVEQPNCGLNNGTVSITATGGTAPYTYLWNTQDTTQTVTGLGGGTYTVTVTDANGCTGTCSVTLTPISGVTANCSVVQQPTCGLNNGIITVTASGCTPPYTYLWNTQDTTQTVSNLGPGTYTVTVTSADGFTATCSLVLNPSEGPLATCNAVQQPTCGLNNGIVSVTASGGTAPYTYLWNTQDTTQTVSNLGGGTYTITVTDAAGCTATCSVTLTPTGGLTADCVAVEQPNCGLNNGTVSITAGGGTAPYTYLWNTQDTTQTVTGLGGGTYTVTVTDANGCTGTCSVTLTPISGVTANCSVVQQPTCGLNNGIITVTASGCTPPYTYLWNTQDTTQTVSNLGSGTYTVTVTSADGFTATCSLVLNPSEGPLATCNAVQQPTCGLNNGIVGVTASGGTAPYTYLWNTQDTTQTVSNLGGGTYTVTVTDAAGCTATCSVTLTPTGGLTADCAAVEQPNCGLNNGTVSITAGGGTAPYTYLWNTQDTTQTVTGLGGGTYTVTVTDANGCTGTCSVTLTPVSGVTADCSVVQQPTCGLNNGIITVTASGCTPPYTYLWNTQDTTQTVSNLGPGTYTVTVTSADGFTATCSLVLNPSEGPLATCNAVQQPTCGLNNGIVSVTASGGTAPYTYLWNTQDTTQTVTGLGGGTYTVTVTDAAGCTATCSVTLTPTGGLTADCIAVEQPNCGLNNGTVSITAGGGTAPYTYLWNTQDTTQTVTGLGGGTYTVTVTDSNGCTGTCSVTLTPISGVTADCSVVQQPTCGLNNGIITVTASGCTPPYTYLWNTQDTTQTVSNLGPGTYTVTVTSADGFTATCSFVLNPSEGPLATCNAVQQPTCGMTDGIVSVTASGGTAPYTYLWNTQDTTQTVTGLGGGTYTVTVTDAAGCTATCSVTLTPTGGLTADCIAVEQPNCGLNNGTVSITAGGGTAPYTYLWNTQDTTQTVTGLGGGTYTVTVTDSNGCTGTCSVTLTPISGVTADCSVVQQPTCGLNNGIITVTASGCTPPYTYLWNTQDTTQTVSNLGPGTYTVTVTSADGFTATCSFVLNPSEGPLATCNAVQQPTCGMTDGIVSVTASGGTAPYTYLWNTQDTTQTVTGLGGGTYTVTVTDAAGCTATCSVTLTPTGGLTADCIAVEQPNCGLNNGTVSITAGGGTAPYTYLWNTQDTTQTVTGLGGGTYTVTVTDANGCTGTCSVTLTPISGVTADCSVVQQPTCGLNNGIITVTASGCTPPYTYLWNTQDTTQTVSNLGPGTYTVTVTSADGFTATCSLVLNPSEGPLATCNAVQQPTCGMTDGIVSVTASGGTAPYTYLWNTQDTTQTVTGLGGGTYTVTVTDAAGCTATCSVTLTPTGGLTADCIAVEQPNCGLNNGTVSITAGGGTAPYTYLWNTQDTTQTVTGLGGGTYTVTVTDANGCTGTCSVTLTPISGVTANCSVVQQPTCGLNNGIITVTASGCTPPYTYLWNTQDTTQTVSNLGPGTYTVTVTSADGFTATCSLVLNPSEGPLATCNAVQQPTCGLNNGIVSVTASGGTAPYTYLWNTQDTTQTVTGLGGGTYTVTVTDAAGCTATCSVTLTPVEGVIANCSVVQQPISCITNNGSVTVTPSGGVAPYTFLWNTQDTTQTISGLGEGIYTVTITDGTGCTNTCSVGLTGPIPPAVAAASNSPVCEGATIELVSTPTSGTAPYTFNWTGPDNFESTAQNPNIPDATEEMNGTYIIRVLDSNGCADSTTVTVVVTTVTANGLVPQTACANEEITLTALNLNPGDTVLWSAEPGILDIDEPTAPATTASGTGGQYTITLQVTNFAGCVADTSFTVNIITVNVEVEVTGKDTICTGESTALLATASGTAAEYSYSWSPAGSLDNANIPNPIASPNGQETYTVTVTGDDLCTATGSVTVYFMETECRDPYIFVPKAFTPNGDGNNDMFRVRGTNITELLFIVYDRWGEEVYRTEDPEHQGWDGTFRGKESTPDSYGWYLRVRCGNGQIFENKGNVTLFK
jgi:gliding motility-associated-like protein